jgi:hypothetical protein
MKLKSMNLRLRTMFDDVELGPLPAHLRMLSKTQLD